MTDPSASPSSAPEADDAGAVFGRTPSGIWILTARSESGAETGVLVSWVQQASFVPLQATIAVQKKRFLHDWFSEQPYVALNLVAEGQKHFLRHFGKGFGPDEPAFENLDLERTPQGVPALAGALGWVEVRVINHLEAGDHLIYLAELTAGGRGPDFDDQRPMVHVRKNARTY